MRTVKKSWNPTRTMRLIIFSQPSVFIRGHLHAQLEHGWWHSAIATLGRGFRVFLKDSSLGCGLYSPFLIYGCSLYTFLLGAARLRRCHDQRRILCDIYVTLFIGLSLCLASLAECSVRSFVSASASLVISLPRSVI